MNNVDGIRMYTVPITKDVEMTLTGYVKVYATSEAEAVAKVQCQVDADTLDDDLEMMDSDSGHTVSYRDLTEIYGTCVEVVEDDIEVEELEEVYLPDVLRADIVQLQKSISWDAETQAKHKAFLQTLIEAQGAAT